MHGVYREVMRQLNHLDIQGWLFVLLGLIFVGFFCLRGFGSRSDY